MKLFVVLFAVFAVIIFFALAVKKGAQNRRDIEEIERAEKNLPPAASDEEELLISGNSQPGLIGSVSAIKNTVGKTLKWLGTIILFAGTITAFYSAGNPADGLSSIQYEFSFLLFAEKELMYCIAGFLLIGLGEVIRLLDEINKRLRLIEKKK